MTSLLTGYKEWVRRNSNLLSLAETGLSCITWILPDRFSESELTLEAVHTAVNLVSTFHDSIINDSATPAAGGEARGRELVFLLGALQQVQVLVELGTTSLERQGLGNRYDALALVEGLKALLRMLILHYSGSRILAHGGLANYEHWAVRGPGAFSPEARALQVVDAFSQFRSRHCQLWTTATSGEPQQLACSDDRPCESRDQSDGMCAQQPALWWQGGEQPVAPVQGASVASQPVERGSGSSVAASEAVQNAREQARRRQTLALRMVIAAELLHILRPLAYTLALRRWGTRSWRPWLTSLAVDLLSWHLTSRGTTLSQSTAQSAAATPPLKGSSTALLLSLQGIRWGRDERDELTRRKLLLAYYLLRDPLFSQATRPALQHWQRLLGSVPLAGWVTGRAVELVCGIQQYYTYTAAS